MPVRTRRGDRGPHRRTFLTGRNVLNVIASQSELEQRIQELVESGYDYEEAEQIANDEVTGSRRKRRAGRRRPNYSTTVSMGRVSDVGDDYEFTDRDTDVEQFMEDFNIDPDEGFGGVFVKKSALETGGVEPEDIYFIQGSVPELDKDVFIIDELRRSKKYRAGFAWDREHLPGKGAPDGRDKGWGSFFGGD